MEGVPSALIHTSDGFAGPGPGPEAGTSDDDDHFDNNSVYPAFGSSISDTSEDQWPPPQPQYGLLPGSIGSRLSSSLHRFRRFWLPRGSCVSGVEDTQYTALLDRHTEPSQMALALDILQATLFSSWINGLLIFVPIGYASYLHGANPTLTFLLNALAIVPLSALLTDATERIANDAGDAIGAILNISLGNLVELILFFALRNNQIRVVQASILGSILVNLLLILGSALLACSLPDQEFMHYAAGTQLLGCLLFVSVFAFLMPTAFDYTFKNVDGSEAASLKMSRISAVMILLIYVVYFIHEVKHHPRTHEAVSSSAGDEESWHATPVPSQPLPALNFLSGSGTLPPRTIRFADEDAAREDRSLKANNQTELDNLGTPDAQDHDEDDFMEHRGRKGNSTASVYDHSRRARTHSRSLSLGSNPGHLSRDSSMDGGERADLMMPYLTRRQILRDNRLDLDRISMESSRVPYGAKIDRIVSCTILFLTSMLMSVSAEFLASTIDDVTHQGHLSESLIGIIIVPIVGNVAEYATVVTVAARDKMGLALAVSVGSSIQIALCVTPLTIIAGWIMDRQLVLAFNFFEIATLLGSVLLVNLLILGEGISGPLRSSGLKGGLMCACYVIIGFGAYLSP